MPVDTNRLLSDARAELADCAATRDRMDKRIAELRILLRTVVRFMPNEGLREQVLAEVEAARRKAPSITESISNLLSQAGKPLTGNEIREQLEATGFDLDEYSQPLATIQSTLQRLYDGKKVKRDMNKDKTVTYRWAGVERGALAAAFKAEQEKK